MGDIVKQILAKPIQLADQVTKAADEATSFKQECADLKAKTEKLALMLRQAARASSDLYERPTRRIIEETEQVLDKALSLVLRCRGNALMKRVFTLNPGAAFRKVSSHLENSIGDISWLLRVSAPADGLGGDYLGGLPPIAANEPILCLIWEQIAVLHTGPTEERADAAASLASLASGSQRYGKLILEEGGVGPLLKLLKEGKGEGQENAARAIGLLGRDPESVEHVIHVGACSVFAKTLKEGPMKVQAMVAWAVSEFAKNHPKCQDLFAQHNIIRLLVGHLAFETVEEHSKYAIVSMKPNSIHALASKKEDPFHPLDKQPPIPHPLGERPRNLHRVITSTIAMHAATKHGNETNPNPNQNQNQNQNQNHQRNYSHSGINMKGRDLEDPGTKANMKEMAAMALWHLAKGNSANCRSITESRALLCFAVLLEKGTEAVQYNSAMAVMEITAVAEKDAELRKSAFKPNSPACKAVVDQVVKIIEKADSKLLDQLRRYQEFYEEGEREILLTEVSSLREQLLQYHGRNSIQGNSNHDIEPQLRNTLDELQECMRNLNYCLEENAKHSREIDSLHSTLSSTNATKVSTEGSFCEAQAVPQIGLKHETQVLKHTEDILNLQLELDIIKVILKEERTFRGLLEDQTTCLNQEFLMAKDKLKQTSKQLEDTNDDLKEAKSVIEALESQHILSILGVICFAGSSS